MWLACPQCHVSDHRPRLLSRHIGGLASLGRRACFFHVISRSPYRLLHPAHQRASPQPHQLGPNSWVGSEPCYVGPSGHRLAWLRQVLSMIPHASCAALQMGPCSIEPGSALHMTCFGAPGSYHGAPRLDLVASSIVWGVGWRLPSTILHEFYVGSMSICFCCGNIIMYDFYEA
jgi:hypothetical protein